MFMSILSHHSLSPSLEELATIQAVSDSNNDSTSMEEGFFENGLAWINLPHPSFWEIMIVLGLYRVLVASLAKDTA
ncbi:hypothetical protein U1Q18_028563 [Sarracenia purpurea var. burkii]